MKRDNEYLSGNQHAAGQSPNKTAFKAGCVPWNKGKKIVSAPGSKETQFKRGHSRTPSSNVGDITVRTDRSGVKRRWIKVSNTGNPQSRWKPFAAYLWEKIRGPIPEGLLVHHLDGDSMNDTLSNYALITRAKHASAHSEQLKAARAKRK